MVYFYPTQGKKLNTILYLNGMKKYLQAAELHQDKLGTKLYSTF